MDSCFKNRIILFFVVIISLVNFDSTIAQTTHVFEYGGYYYFKIIDSDSYELKIGMYGEEYINGKYEINSDTLVLTSFNFNLKYKKDYKELFKDRFTKSLIIDSLLIPVYFYEMEFKKARRFKRDSVLIDKYMMNDGHANYIIELKLDSIFSYHTRGGKGGNRIDGKWFRDDNKLILMPEPHDHPEVLKWICTSYEMLFVNDKFLVGKTTGEDRYMYLFKR